MPGIDRELFYWINHWPEGLQPFFWFWSEAIKLTPTRVALLLLVMLLLTRKPWRPMVLIALVAFPLANELTDILKAVVQMPRPSVDFPGAIVRNVRLTSFGTASAHSANMAAVATSFFMLGGWRWGVPWVVVAFLTGLSRIYNGAHYPSQVLLGWLCGIAVSASLVWLYRRFLGPKAAIPVESTAAD